MNLSFIIDNKSISTSTFLEFRILDKLLTRFNFPIQYLIIKLNSIRYIHYLVYFLFNLNYNMKIYKLV